MFIPTNSPDLNLYLRPHASCITGVFAYNEITGVFELHAGNRSTDSFLNNIQQVVPQPTSKAFSQVVYKSLPGQNKSHPGPNHEA